MPRGRRIAFTMSGILAFAGSIPSLHAQPVTYTVRTLANQIPAGDAFLAEAATTTPAGVEIVGLRAFHNGSNDRTPAIFPTSTSNMQVMNNPPSDSTRGVISAVAYVPSLGVIEAGQYDKLVISTLSTHAVTWNGSPNSAVDIHATSNTGAITVADTIAYAVSSSPNGFQAAGKTTGIGNDQAIMWTGATPQTAQVIKLHDDVTMFESVVSGVYTFNGVAKQVGSSEDRTSNGGFTQPRARVWTGSAASAIDLTPPGFLFAGISGGNGDGPLDILCGSSGTSLYDIFPTIWFGTGGTYRTLDTTADHPVGGIHFCTQTSGVGNLNLDAFGGSSHAAVWDFATGHVIDLHNYLPPEYQLSGGSSTAFYEDAFGNVYGQATTNGSSAGVPVVWLTSVPEPSSLSLMVVAALSAWVGRRHIRSRSQRGTS